MSMRYSGGDAPSAQGLPFLPGIMHSHKKRSVEPSGSVRGLATKPKGWSDRHALRSCVRRRAGRWALAVCRRGGRREFVLRDARQFTPREGRRRRAAAASVSSVMPGALHGRSRLHVSLGVRSSLLSCGLPINPTLATQ